MSPKSVALLVEEALDSFDGTGMPLSAQVRKALRIATKLQDYPSLLRLYMETFDLSLRVKIDHPQFQQAQENMTALLGKDAAMEEIVSIVRRWERDRSMVGGENIYGVSVEQIEENLATLDAQLADLSAPVAPGSAEDSIYVRSDKDKAAAKLVPIRGNLHSVLSRIRAAVFDILLNTETRLVEGRFRPDVFERGGAYVKSAMQEYAPAALDKLESAEESLLDGSGESLAHALTSCRRAIKSLADALYPATGEVIVGGDGKERTMNDESFRNRLIQFAVEHFEGTAQRKLANETLRSLGTRLEILVDLASKGVHADVSREEAESCVMWTYLAAADFLRIKDGTFRGSVANVEEARSGEASK